MEDAVRTTSLRTQSAWLLLAKVAGFFFTFLLPLLTVRFLTKDDVGTYRQVFQIIANAAAVLPLGISLSAYYYLSREKENRGAAVLNILIFHVFVGLVAFGTLALFPELPGRIFNNPELVVLAPKIGFVILLWIFSAFLETVAVANQEARLASAFIILAQFSKTLLMVAAVVSFHTVEAFVYAAMIQAAIQSFVLVLYLRSRFPRFWTQFRWDFFKTQFAYALPFGFAGLLWIMQTDLHNYFVGHRFSPAEYAIYAYGCFELPLIGMIHEAVSSVMIPRMSKLQDDGDRDEMVRVTARAMHKLAFFYFPMYVFLMITAHTFIVTLFTKNFAASVPIFMINITVLPFYVFLFDPVVRAFKELGRVLLTVRLFVFAALVAALYFGVQSFDLRGMIAIVVAAILTEKFITSIFVFRKLGIGRNDLGYLSTVGKTGGAAIVAGMATFLFYHFASLPVETFASGFLSGTMGIAKASIVDFLAGSTVLGISFAIFAPIYLLGAHFLGFIDEEDRETVLGKLRMLRDLISGRKRATNVAGDN